MKCAVAFCVLLAAGSAALANTPDSSVTVLEDLVRMSRAGSSDAAVLAYARAHRSELPAELPDSTLRWLRASGVGDRVVRYMRAIDVRDSGPVTSGPEGVTYADEDPGDRRPDKDSEENLDPDRMTGFDGDTEAYAGYDSDRGGDEYDSGFRYEPYFGYPYLSAPYFSYFHVDRGGFRRFGGHRSHRGGGWRDRGRPRDAWRDRGSGGRPRGAIATGPRHAGRSFAGGGFRGARDRTRTLGPRGFGSPRSGPARSWAASPGHSRSGFPRARGEHGSPRSSAGFSSRSGAGHGRGFGGGRGRR